MVGRTWRVFFPVLLVFMAVRTAPSLAEGGMLCPFDGKEYAKSEERCPEHGFKLVRADEFYRDPLTGMGFIRVEGGCFEMGLRDAGGAQAPLHKECVDTFWMGVFEVTQAQWFKVMEENLATFQDCGPDCPVENVSMIDAQEYVGMLRRLDAGTFRLPNEAEWEYAARGGRRSKGYRYAGSNDPAAVAWYKDNSDNKTHPVGRKQPNELGLYDMSGNVWEWVEGSYEEPGSGKEAQRNPQGRWATNNRVIRGGGWISGDPMIRPGFRTNHATGGGNSSLGCRLVAVPEAASSSEPAKPKPGE